MQISPIFLSTLLVLASSHAFSKSEWRQGKERDGITVFTKDIPGSGVVALKAETDIDAPAAKVAQVIVDIEHMTDWAPNLVEARKIRQIDEASRIQYNHTSVPWPLKDRDFVILSHGLRDTEAKMMIFDFKSVVDPEVPVVKNLVRGELDGTYKLTSLGPHKCHLIFEVSADPKGSVPKWIINLFQTSWPRKTLYSLRRQAMREAVVELPEARAFFDGLVAKSF